MGLSLIEKSITEELRATMEEVGETVWTLSLEVEYFEERTEKLILDLSNVVDQHKNKRTRTILVLSISSWQSPSSLDAIIV